MTASGHLFSAAFFNVLKSSSVIFTFTCTVRFMPLCIVDLGSLNNVTNSIIGTQRAQSRRALDQR